ncbi:hypothetical protein BJ742DRAFT_814165 [Cladochytrium replicatum]|nr:hypothetical protein BJ742DRAFT_814165 [Cladochytrium replicatum]
MIMRAKTQAALMLLLLPFLVIPCGADEHSHTYANDEEVVVWMNTVGPAYNRQETYEYLQLPYCVGDKEVEHHHETLGEALLGVQLVRSGMDIRFKKDEYNSTICTKQIRAKDITLFKYAVSNQYIYQMYVDDLPVLGYVGPSVEQGLDEVNLYTHKELIFSYNGNQIIEVSLKPGNPTALTLDSDREYLDVRFSFSVNWVPTSQTFNTRFNKYLDSKFFEHKIHWFSIFNSFMMVMFLIGLVTVILLRTLKRDYARYDKEEGLMDLDRDLGDEFGWKQVHGDVFRPPTKLTWISALLGTGMQLNGLALIVILYTIVGDLYLERATILTATIFIYALTSMISGYYSGSYYNQYGGKNWIRTMFITAGLWPGTVSLTALSINFIAIYYTSSRAIPFTTMIAIIAIWLFLVFPLTLLGAIVGRNWAGEPHFPCRVNPIPRPIPDKAWYSEPTVIVALGGILPFGSIFIEMYFIFTSFWDNRIYYVYGFMLLVFIMLVIVTACVSIVSTYFLLNSEDHRWHWISFMSSASTGVYIFAYSIYYFFARTKMNGLFQTAWYFGYTGLACAGISIMLGTIGHLASEKFIRRIYSNVKID